MKTHSKILSLVLACVLAFASTSTVFAAEPATEVSDVQEIPVVFEDADDGIAQHSVGGSTTFNLGQSGSISNCGTSPKFQMWATGGNGTKVVFNIKTSGGVSYTQGPVSANGSVITKSYLVFKGSGSWTFSAYIESGPDTGNIVCHVKQID